MTLRKICYSGPIDIPNITGLILELQKSVQDKVSEVYIELPSAGGRFNVGFKAYDFLWR